MPSSIFGFIGRIGLTSRNEKNLEKGMAGKAIEEKKIIRVGETPANTLNTSTNSVKHCFYFDIRWTYSLPNTSTLRRCC